MCSTSFISQRLCISDMADLIALQRDVAAGAPAGFMRSKTEDELAAAIEGRTGAAFGIRANDALIAAAMLAYPGPLPENAPAFPRVPPADWPTRVALFETCIVRADMRGHGLQRALFDARIVHARQAGRRWFCAGVHADNTASWRNLIRKRMAIVGMGFFGASPIFALLRAEDRCALATAGPFRAIARKDIDGHERALNDGMICTEIAAAGVLYRRAIAVNPTGRAVIREIA